MSNHSLPKYFRQRFGKPHLDLACHAAFPLALTPELLYLLRENFLPNTPYIAVADILLILCDPVGYQLYELDPKLRHELLNDLIKDSRFGETRLKQLSDFMVAYIKQELQTNDYAAEDFGAAPHWTALAYTNSQAAVKDIAQALKNALEKTPADWVKLSYLMESYADTDPLIKAGFKPLLTLSRGWEAKARGDEETAEAEFRQLRQQYGDSLKFEDLELKIPSEGDDSLSTFSFEVVTVNRRGEITKTETKQAQYFTENLGDRVTLDMVAIPGGKFMMGSPQGEGDKDEYPQHQVTVSPFFMGKYQVTQAQWRAVAKLPQVERELQLEPSRFKGDDLPVEKISWYDAEEFCKRLSKYTGRQYRLPTEAEWEYACRAGTKTPFHFGETITGELANYDASNTFADEPKKEYREKTTVVGSFKPNAFGLYDMHGNVWEWCQDHWHDDYQDAPEDGSAWLIDADDNDNQIRVLRGGSWYVNPVNCRSAYRSRDDPVYDGVNDGFRVVCVGAAARTM
ncbi:formylglycine-generating enzyme family protein [Anabaena sp. 4-3]|uniref:formylglycine-generating enzyme family protein n=1 Tax=Anabaena sp. 4-3 TaxID=1811979 RepID=UPI000830A1D3|nr:formylglycine-generating enzyme family protein [Anabaena sp. 4-3]